MVAKLKDFAKELTAPQKGAAEHWNSTNSTTLGEYIKRVEQTKINQSS